MSAHWNPDPGDRVVKVKGVRIYKGETTEGRDDLCDLVDSLRGQIRIDSGVIVLGWKSEDKVALVASVSKDLTDKLDAVKILTEAGAHVGGVVSGHKDFAEAEGTKPTGLEEALKAIPAIIEKML